MKVRCLNVRHFRNFGELTRIGFDDEPGGRVRPLSILVGSNGSGKTTVFSLIEGLLSFAVDTVEDTPITWEVREAGFASLQLDIEPEAPVTAHDLMIALGQINDLPQRFAQTDRTICHIALGYSSGRPLKPRVRKLPAPALNRWIRDMLGKKEPLRAGLLHFPHNRWVEQEQRGAIEPSPPDSAWIWRFDPRQAWQGSLAQLWVWQNYLDLEQAKQGRENLAPFVEVVEQILGGGRKVVIREGHVRIEKQGSPSVELHQLPSGEQQVLTLFGELARRVRPGAVVMIDEVEISLHPALQRSVLHHLRALARKYDLQILLSTHSMELVKAAAPDEIVRLDDMVPAELGGP